jgi:hypothetical protein
MSYSLESIAPFKRELKRLIKKYPSLRTEIEELGKSLRSTPFQGKSLGGNVYKIRLRIASKQAGKSGGARVITCVKVVRETVYLLSIYDKSEQSDISDEKIAELLDELPPERP